MVFWSSSKSPHICHGTKATWKSRFNKIGAPKERWIWKHFVVYGRRNLQRNVFFTFLLTILSRNHSYHVTQPCSLVPLHNTIGVLCIFLSERVRTLWILFLYTFTSRLKAYALPNLAVCLHQRVSNSKSPNDSRIDPSPVLILNKISIFDICLTVHHWYKWYKHQLDGTITAY